MSLEEIDFMERDVSIVGGVGRFHGVPVVVIAQERGKSLDEKISHRFGMPNPEVIARQKGS